MPRAKKAKKYSAGQIYDAIAAAHAAPEWACFPEVGSGTGGHYRRSADAVAMSLWPSRGLIIRGFEIKVSRSDYRREAADPMKAETVAKYCDEWWIVTPEGLIEDVELELPPAWGLMVLGPKGLHTVRKATVTEAEPVGRVFAAALFRAAQKKMAAGLRGYVREEDIADEIKKAEERGKADVPFELQTVKRDRDRMKEALDAWKEATGIDLVEGMWRSSVNNVIAAYKLGKALRGRYNDVNTLKRSWANMEKTAREMKERLDEVLPDEEEDES